MTRGGRFLKSARRGIPDGMKKALGERFFSLLGFILIPFRSGRLGRLILFGRALCD